jgi:hypothetical protein
MYNHAFSRCGVEKGKAGKGRKEAGATGAAQAVARSDAVVGLQMRLKNAPHQWRAQSEVLNVRGHKNRRQAV